MNKDNNIDKIAAVSYEYDDEKTIATDAAASLSHARDVLKAPFPLGEKTIATDGYHSYLYAKDILKGPFPLGEASIAKNVHYSYDYARDVLKGRFILGEKTIATDAGYSYCYAKDVLKGRFELGEKALEHSYYRNNYLLYLLNIKDASSAYEEAFRRTQRFELGEELIATDSRYSYLYANYVLKGPFLLGEKTIATNYVYSYFYALDVLKRPFLLGEEAIAKDAIYSYYYAKDVLKKRFELGEKTIAKDSYYKNEYEEKFDCKLDNSTTTKGTTMNLETMVRNLVNDKITNSEPFTTADISHPLIADDPTIGHYSVRNIIDTMRQNDEFSELGYEETVITVEPKPGVFQSARLYHPQGFDATTYKKTNQQLKRRTLSAQISSNVQHMYGNLMHSGANALNGNVTDNNQTQVMSTSACTNKIRIHKQKMRSVLNVSRDLITLANFSRSAKLSVTRKGNSVIIHVDQNGSRTLDSEGRLRLYSQDIAFLPDTVDACVSNNTIILN
jgi:hypothetical protein